MVFTRARAIMVLCAIGSAALYGLYSLTLEQGALTADTAATDAQTLDWSDLIPREEVDAGMRIRDGSLARGVVEHGGLLPKSGEVPTVDTVPSIPTPHELATGLGAYNSLDAPPRRLADAFGGIGNLRFLQPRGGSIRSDLDGKLVRIAGFVAPLAFDGGRISEFLLVPYVGACIHVPPPPANQIVYVSNFGTYKLDGGLLYPVWVTGRLVAAPLETGLADVGYRIEGARVSRYE